MPLAHRTWLQRIRRTLCVQYQDLCNLSMTDEKRKKGNKLSPENRERVKRAREYISKGIDELNAIVELPPGS